MDPYGMIRQEQREETWRRVRTIWRCLSLIGTGTTFILGGLLVRHASDSFDPSQNVHHGSGALERQIHENGNTAMLGVWLGVTFVVIGALWLVIGELNRKFDWF